MAGSWWSKNSVAPVSKSGDSGHLIGGELEVEDIDVLAHPFGADRLGDDHDIALDEPAQDDLGD
jgi:hypothetical protein